MSSSPFASFQNSVLRFQVSTGELKADANGNLRPGTAVLEVKAMLSQKSDARIDRPPGVDQTSIYIEGYLTEIASQESLALPSIVSPDSPCQAVWQGRNGKFLMVFRARSPYLAALNIDLVEKIRGWFQPSSFVVEGEPWVPSDPDPDPEPIASLNLTRQVFTITTTGQAVFTLGSIAVSPQLSELYLNGVKATYGTEYLINSTTLTWLMALQLQPSDELEILYYFQP